MKLSRLAPDATSLSLVSCGQGDTWAAFIYFLAQTPGTVDRSRKTTPRAGLETLAVRSRV